MEPCRASSHSRCDCMLWPGDLRNPCEGSSFDCLRLRRATKFPIEFNSGGPNHPAGPGNALKCSKSGAEKTGGQGGQAVKAVKAVRRSRRSGGKAVKAVAGRLPRDRPDRLFGHRGLLLLRCDRPDRL